MQIEKVTGERARDSYYKIQHPSGLSIYLYPKESCSTAYAVFGAKYGSIDTCFQRSDETKPETVPEGIAHYLEHKLFESEDGDAFERFAKTGASANAFTSFESTCYLFSCTDQLYESLEILLDFVQSPHFTEESVAKEQGIIGQEIKMYDDDPQWRVMFNYLRAMYHTHPIRQDIAGTVESIAEITPEYLYRCYRTFYNLGNMALCIAGRLDVERVLEVCARNLKTSKPVQVKRVFAPEPETVVTAKVEQRLSVSLPLFQFGFKEAVSGECRTEREIAAMEILLETMASDSSPLFQDLLNRGLINETSFSYEYFEGSGYATVMFGGESRDPQAVAEAIVAETERLKRTGIDPAA
ncbi:MAG: pitrilysin family protein, partial [Oscillospiraceae bacterium]|nr:pitrilysin family protein [Oscillospiraceae bacterium]